MKAAVAPTQQLIQRLLDQQKSECFICQKPIDTAADSIEVDHIIPRARGGKDDENNYAATHEWCNRTKSDADLRVARCLAQYEQIKDKCSAEDPKRPHLGDFLNEFGGGKFSEPNAQPAGQNRCIWDVRSEKLNNEPSYLMCL